MRLWHPQLIQDVPLKRLAVLHMALCKVRSRPWGKPTPRAWYYNLSWPCLVWYHSLVIRELQSRGWNVYLRWLEYQYRGNAEPSPVEYHYDFGHIPEFERICPESKEKQRKLLQRLL